MSSLSLFAQWRPDANNQRFPRTGTHVLRRVNGKAVLHRVKGRNGLRDDPAFLLARAIRVSGSIPGELKGIVQAFCPAAE